MGAIIDTMIVSSALVSILADNSATLPYRAEHGFSALIELRGAETSRFVLFDTGLGALFDNAPIAGADFSLVSDLVLSHGHYDHTDALEPFLSRYPGIHIHSSQEIYRDHYSLRTGKCRNISLSDANRSELSRRTGTTFFPFDGQVSVADGQVHLASSIPLNHPLEMPSHLLFSDAECTIPDTVPDEIVLWIETSRGLMILTGCCHAGFINTCEYVRSLSGSKQIHTVIGGFHLAGVKEERMQATLAYIRNQDIRRIVPCHCTGNNEISFLSSHLGSIVTKGQCGTCIQID